MTPPAAISPPGPLSEPPPGPQVLTFGCRLNALESDGVRAMAVEAGLSDAVIVNTCAVTAEAVRQAKQAIRRAKRARPSAPIIVTGCAAQIDPASFAAMAQVDRVLGNGAKTDPKAWIGLMAEAEPVRVSDIMAVRSMAPHLAPGFQPRTRAYVQVQNGCDHRCTFCVIPYGRGNARSAPAGAVVEEVRSLARAGAPEVVLTGVDLTSWGADLPGQPGLGDLVSRILRLVPELPRLRLSSIDAIEVDDTLLRLVGEEPRFAPYLHLSLQHGDDLILKRMKRRHNRAEAIALCARLRRVRPDIALGADLIAGFPTEDDAHFAQSVSLIAECGLAFVHVFPYSARPGTPAAKMPQLARAVVKARAATLRAAAQSALSQHLERWTGRVGDVLIEEAGRGRLADFTQVRGVGGEAGTSQRIRFAGHDGTALFGLPA